MDFNRIIENGYGKLSEKLPEYEKGVLDGISAAVAALENFKDNMDCGAETEIIGKIKQEIAEEVVDDAKRWLESEHDEHLVAFVDDNNYSIDENGNIVKDDE